MARLPGARASSTCSAGCMPFDGAVSVAQQEAPLRVARRRHARSQARHAVVKTLYFIQQAVKITGANCEKVSEHDRRNGIYLLIGISSPTAWKHNTSYRSW